MKRISFLIAGLILCCFGLDLQAHEFAGRKATRSRNHSRGASFMRTLTAAEAAEKKVQGPVSGLKVSKKQKHKTSPQVQVQEQGAASDSEYFDAVPSFDEPVSRDVENLEVEVPAQVTLHSEEPANEQQAEKFVAKVIEEALDKLKLVDLTPEQLRDQEISKAFWDHLAFVPVPGEPAADFLAAPGGGIEETQKSGFTGLAADLLAAPGGIYVMLSLEHLVTHKRLKQERSVQPSFISRNKGKILATGAVLGGVAYYAATRGLRPETMVQDLRTAKDFCVRNAGKIREQAPVLLESGKAKLTAGLAIATGCALNGLAKLGSLFEDADEDN